jgi:hypothetical protein
LLEVLNGRKMRWKNGFFELGIGWLGPGLHIYLIYVADSGEFCYIKSFGDESRNLCRFLIVPIGSNLCKI